MAFFFPSLFTFAVPSSKESSGGRAWLSVWQPAGFAEDFGSVCDASALAAKEARLADEFEQLIRVLLEVAFRPVAECFCHARREQRNAGLRKPSIGGSISVRPKPL